MWNTVDNARLHSVNILANSTKSFEKHFNTKITTGISLENGLFEKDIRQLEKLINLINIVFEFDEKDLPNVNLLPQCTKKHKNMRLS